MNILAPLASDTPDREEAERALEVLRKWALSADASEQYSPRLPHPDHPLPFTTGIPALLNEAWSERE